MYLIRVPRIITHKLAGAIPLTAILFCRATKEYAEKGTRTPCLSGALHFTVALWSGKTRVEALKHLPLSFSNQLFHTSCVTWGIVVQRQN